ncbi:hypothetical protein [Aliamphritea ceti]|uniref:hypothetical protein n=1 Tax=Aliamphritea ceti TaxID=1524258 RepID=UPI0021C39077|nr:hypothetical protein [Aliamphritea ceti]
MSKIIGNVKCLMGGNAQVTQAKRKGSHFMLRCDCCGFDQSTGKQKQQYIWDNAKWVDGIPPAPVNVDVNKGSETVKPAEKQPKAAADFDPTEPPKTVEDKPKKKGGVIVAVAGVAALLGLGVALARA